MTIEVDKKDLESLVLGLTPSSSASIHPLVRSCGSWRGVDESWRWDYSAVRHLPEVRLAELYQVCKENKAAPTTVPAKDEVEVNLLATRDIPFMLPVERGPWHPGIFATRGTGSRKETT